MEHGTPVERVFLKAGKVFLQRPIVLVKIFLFPLRSKGFTLLEVLTVIAILGVLSAIAVPNFLSYRQRALDAAALETMKNISKKIDIFNIDYNRYPNNLNEIGLGGVLDPWGRPFQYLNIALVAGKGPLRKDHSLVPVNTDYDLYSMGRDGKSQPPFTAKASRDDLVRANNGSFFGLVSDY